MYGPVIQLPGGMLRSTFDISPNKLSNKCSAYNVRRGWFIGIEWGLGPVHLGSIRARAGRFTLSKFCTYTCVLAIQAIHPFRVGKLGPAICRE